MKINKKIISKIEGEAVLKIQGKEKIEFVEIEFWQNNGIEEYLKNRHFLDALVVNPRVCGICGHSHLFATAKVIEKVFDVKISSKAKIFREITTSLEIVQNHIKWFYMTLFPTIIKDKKYIFKAVKFASEISKAIAVLAGQFPHNSYIVPGGVTCDPTYVEIIKLENILKKIKEDYMKEIMDEELFSCDLNLFFENLPKDIGKSLNRFLVLGNNAFFEANGTVEKVEEEKGFFKNAFYKGEFYEVGSLARSIVREDKIIKKIYKEYKDGIYTRVVSRLYEALLLLKYVNLIIKKVDLREKSFEKPSIKDGKAKIAVEAPRGSLIHEIEIKNEKISFYNIIVPTQFNLGSSKKRFSPAQEALIGEDLKYTDVIFKCFDVCAVCMSH
ncbi:MAG: nickel-dependent hydrogenase large subunit [Nautiliaceae bacterium]